MRKTKMLFAFLFLAVITTVFAGCGSDSKSTTTATALSVTTASLAGATVGTPYSQPLAATGGTTPYTWSISAGTLPAGLSLNASTGLISGTPTTAGAATNFTVKVTDSAAPAATATKALSITVGAPAALSITTASPLAAGTVGNAYGPVTLIASGGTAPYTWTVAGGSALPAGLLLSTGGVISGTPTAAGTVSTNFTVTDAAAGTVTKALSIIVNAAGTPLSITTTSPLAAGTVGVAYGPVTMVATGGTTPYTWTVAAGSALPAGLLLSTGGVISGTPTAAGTVSTNFTVTDAAAGTVTKALSITVAPAAIPLSITTASPLAAGAVGSPYGPVTLAATGGTAPYTWTVAAGSALPAGLLLSTGGVISGVPTAAGTVSTNFTATDAAAGTVTKALSITVSVPPALTTLTPSCAGACHGLPPTVTGLTFVVPGLTSPMPHTTNTLCGVCHEIGGWVPGTTTFNMAGVGTHNNGTINFLAGLPTATCGACHGLPPVSANHPAVATKAYAANCGICHPVGPGNPITFTGIGTHNNGTINFIP